MARNEAFLTGAANREGGSERPVVPRGRALSRALAIGALIAWAIGTIAMPVGAWIWFRAGRSAMGAALAGSPAVWWRKRHGWPTVAADGLDAILDPTPGGFTGWGAWALGIARGRLGSSPGRGERRGRVEPCRVRIARSS